MATEPMEEEWQAPEENDPPPDFSREDAAFERERPRLVRDHLGKFALVRLDEVVGVFDTPEEAMIEGFRRFGDERRMVIRTITEQDEVLDITSGFSCEPLD